MLTRQTEIRARDWLLGPLMLVEGSDGGWRSQQGGGVMTGARLGVLLGPAGLGPLGNAQ